MAGREWEIQARSVLAPPTHARTYFFAQNGIISEAPLHTVFFVDFTQTLLLMFLKSLHYLIDCKYRLFVVVSIIIRSEIKSAVIKIDSIFHDFEKYFYLHSSYFYLFFFQISVNEKLVSVYFQICYNFSISC